MSSSGVNFPKDGEQRPTTAVNQGAFAKCVETASPQLAQEVRSVKNWRSGYAAHVLKQVELACKSEENALSIAQDGLAFMHKTMVFERDGAEVSVTDAMAGGNKKFMDSKIFHTGVVKGTGILPKGNGLQVPYKGGVLSGAPLVSQIETWVRRGVIELSTGQALINVVQNESWSDLTDQTVVLVGAGSAMGPFPLLMAMGCNVVALDLPRKGIWDRLISIAKDSPGTITFPMSRASTKESEFAELAGCDLLAQTPEIRNWLLDVRPGERLLVGAYAYLDGPLFVRVSVAMDAIIESLMTLRKGPKIAIAYLCTPTDAHVSSAAAHAQASNEARKAPMWQKLYGAIAGMACPKRRLASNSRKPVVADDGTEYFVTDATVVEQGPNYILAKRLQHWRAVFARSQGHLVSTNIAPATATASVVSNKLFALAYEGQPYFTPIEVFEGPTSNAVMAALLVNDLRNPLSVANPDRKLRNPMELFSENSFHGGAWRCAYKYNAIGLPSIAAGLVGKYGLKYYLVLYNAVQTIGWSVILAKVVEAVIRGGFAGLASSWVSAGPLVVTMHYVMLLEILHSVLGLVRSNPVTAAIQVYSRLQVCIILKYSGNNPALLTGVMLLAWSITEAIRHAYLASNLLQLPSYLLKWCRYSFFFVLYPMGVSGELGSLAASWQDVQEWPLDRNSFDTWLINCAKTIIGVSGNSMFLLYAIYAPGLAFLYTHMISQRGKALGGGASAKKSKTA
ncbi:unnamed protein product [Amoebophrya sp. A25]|nr:unnamed protein product [Amoebophrya sp. A25]|eukprot:GSA25T00022186001.1